MRKKMSRRQFLTVTLSALGGITLAEVIHRVSKAQALMYQKSMPLVSPGVDPTRTPTPTVTPTVTPTPTKTATPAGLPDEPPIPDLPPLPEQSIVTHVRHASATNWGGLNSATPYWQSVNQTAVDAMMLAGIKDLTGQSTESASWDVLFRRIYATGYQTGQKIAIKVNFNCARYDGGSCTTHSTTRIDALPQVVMSVVESLHRSGVPYNAIYIFDSTGDSSGNYGKPMYQYFRNFFSGKDVHFVGQGGCGNMEATTYGKHSSQTVNFASQHMAKGLKARKLADTLYHSYYLINIPILKCHGSDQDTGFTAAFKNHLGSIDYVYASAENNSLHSYIQSGYTSYYSSTIENPMVSIYKNPHIAGKTILTICDGLFGGEWEHRPLNSWTIFGGQPANSLMFAVDAVALDCVVADMMRSEPKSQYYQGNDKPYDYLKQAANLNLGRFESQYPYNGTDKYQAIVYNRINLS